MMEPDIEEIVHRPEPTMTGCGVKSADQLAALVRNPMLHLMSAQQLANCAAPLVAHTIEACAALLAGAAAERVESLQALLGWQQVAVSLASSLHGLPASALQLLGLHAQMHLLLRLHALCLSHAPHLLAAFLEQLASWQTADQATRGLVDLHYALLEAVTGISRVLAYSCGSGVQDELLKTVELVPAGLAPLLVASFAGCSTVEAVKAVMAQMQATLVQQLAGVSAANTSGTAPETPGDTIGGPPAAAEATAADAGSGAGNHFGHFGCFGTAPWEPLATAGGAADADSRPGEGFSLFAGCQPAAQPQQVISGDGATPEGIPAPASPLPQLASPSGSLPDGSPPSAAQLTASDSVVLQPSAAPHEDSLRHCDEAAQQASACSDAPPASDGELGRQPAVLGSLEGAALALRPVRTHRSMGSSSSSDSSGSSGSTESPSGPDTPASISRMPSMLRRPAAPGGQRLGAGAAPASCQLDNALQPSSRLGQMKPQLVAAMVARQASACLRLGALALAATSTGNAAAQPGTALSSQRAAALCQHSLQLGWLKWDAASRGDGWVADVKASGALRTVAPSPKTSAGARASASASASAAACPGATPVPSVGRRAPHDHSRAVPALSAEGDSPAAAAIACAARWRAWCERRQAMQAAAPAPVTGAPPAGVAAAVECGCGAGLGKALHAGCKRLRRWLRELAEHDG